MISRGYFIGAIVDEFSTIAEKISMRSRLGMTDLSTHAEDYFRNVLNQIYGWNLKSLNKTRPNEPGLDLGDATSRVGIQITSDASSAKVKATLAAITDDQKEIYETILILIVGKKQSSYSIDADAATRVGFKEQNIWDLTQLARDTLSLGIDKLDALHTFVNREAARLRVELEVPDKEGNYPTTNYNQWEQVAVPIAGSGEAFVRFIMETYNDGLEEKHQADIRDSIVVLVEELRQLPRITREFLAVLIERREAGEGRRKPNTAVPRVILLKLERLYLGDDLKGELQILEDAGLVSIEGENEYEYGPVEIYVWLSRNEDLSSSFVDFIDKNDLDIRQVIGNVDFSEF